MSKLERTIVMFFAEILLPEFKLVFILQVSYSDNNYLSPLDFAKESQKTNFLALNQNNSIKW